jgi:hypothetical protein
VLGSELAGTIGEPADYIGAGVFVALGIYLLLDRNTSEVEHVRKRISENAFGLIGLGIRSAQMSLRQGLVLAWPIFRWPRASSPSPSRV